MAACAERSGRCEGLPEATSLCRVSGPWSLALPQQGSGSSGLVLQKGPGGPRDGGDARVLEEKAQSQGPWNRERAREGLGCPARGAPGAHRSLHTKGRDPAQQDPRPQG